MKSPFWWSSRQKAASNLPRLAPFIPGDEMYSIPKKVLLFILVPRPSLRETLLETKEQIRNQQDPEKKEGSFWLDFP